MQNVVTKRHARYGISSLSDAWEKQHFRGTDLFFKHRQKDAMIYLKVFCEKFSDSPLAALRAQMLANLGKYDILSDKLINIAGREALVSEAIVKVDGVERFLKMMALRKNRCVFDVVLSAQQSFPDIVNDYDEMIESFWAEADL